MRKLLALTFFVLLIAACGSPGSQPGLKAPVKATDRPPATKPWLPSGFTRWDDETAYRWLPSESYSCSYSRGKCAAAEIVVHHGCLDLYVEVAFYDSSGIQIDWTNATAKGLLAGGKARLIFDTFEDQADKARMVEIHCY